MHRLSKDYEKPEFAITSVKVDGVDVAVQEQVVIEKPFCRLLRFKRFTDDPKALETMKAQPTVLVVAPLSGHHSTLLRDTVKSLLHDHKVFITDWTDARMVPLVFGRFDLGEVPTSVKVGRHTLYWGESLFLGGNINGIAYAQNPLDLQKGFATPGTEAKELFRPLNQLSGQAQITDPEAFHFNALLGERPGFDPRMNSFPFEFTWLDGPAVTRYLDVKSVSNEILSIGRDLPFGVSLTSMIDAAPGSGLGSSSALVVALVRRAAGLSVTLLERYDVMRAAAVGRAMRVPRWSQRRAAPPASR